jgi:diaminohydroxyphosphoribosylaminopyrimidine deaminase/5-amino-6-(5-phosphoribosylamino)uracil reductase
LEPCNHHGKTPPCADLIVRKGFGAVVCAMQDPNPLVAGKGLRKIKDAGCNVIVGNLEKEAKFLNRQFSVNMLENRPFYTAKWAQTANGFMGTDSPNKNGKITGYTSDALVHRMRAENDAILIGSKTAQLDNPKLNVRKWHGKNPLRVVLDPEGTLREDLLIFSDGLDTLVFSNVSKRKNAVEFIQLKKQENIWNQIDQTLMDRNIGTVMVEGGRFTLEHLISLNHVDEIYRFTNQALHWESGIHAPEMPWPIHSKNQMGNDLLEFALNPNQS